MNSNIKFVENIERDLVDEDFRNALIREPYLIFSSPTEFSKFIETKSYLTSNTLVDTLLDFLEKYDVEPEKIKNLISDSLQSKIKQEFIHNGLLKSTSNLTDLIL